MVADADRRLVGRQRAAGLLIALGPDVSAKILGHLREEEIEVLAREITNMGSVPPELRDELLQEFYNIAVTKEYVTVGGLNYAMEMLEKALGRQKAEDIASRVFENQRRSPFSFVRDLEASQILSFLNNEHPQAVALILSFVAPDKAAAVLSALTPGLQAEVAVRIARMDRTSPEVVLEVESLMRRKLSSLLSSRHEMSQAGGVQALVKLLKQVDRTSERSILEALEQQDAKLAEDIKKQMFVFENIVQLDDRSIRRVLREVDPKDLGLALKGASEEVRRRVLANLSSRAAAMLQEDMEATGPVRVRHVEEAQGRIVNIIRALDEAEEIVISRGGDDEVLA